MQTGWVDYGNGYKLVKGIPVYYHHMHESTAVNETSLASITLNANGINIGISIRIHAKLELMIAFVEKYCTRTKLFSREHKI